MNVVSCQCECECVTRRILDLATHLRSEVVVTSTGYNGRPSADARSATNRAINQRVIVRPRGTATPTAGEQPIQHGGPAAVSIEGRPIRSQVFGSGDGPAILILGGIHGNEPAGKTLCEALWDHLAQRSLGDMDGNNVVVAPEVNPDGLARNTRENARGIDLNRNFETTNRESARAYGSAGLSEPESRFVAHLIAYFSPAAIVSVHQPLACVDYDGPAEMLAATMSRACCLPVEKLANSKPYPGSLGTYAGVDRGIPIVTLELPGDVSTWNKEQLWTVYGAALLEAVHYRPRIAGNGPGC
eukprot:COSAG02_NODE_9381_length_2236_cov_2.464202_2_plen_300_part_00